MPEEDKDDNEAGSDKEDENDEEDENDDEDEEAQLGMSIYCLFSEMI